jgi:hypothetical protein
MTTVFFIVVSLSFFWPVWWRGKLPIPADALVGLYHPYRDYFSNRFPQGVPYKNFILTDPVLQQYPWKWLAINQLRSIPKGYSFKDTPFLDNPYSFSGYAAGSAENIQAGTFYPLNFIFFLTNSFSTGWTIFIMVQPLLAIFFMYLYLKSLSLSRLAALLGGTVWAFSSFNLVWMEWGNIGHAGLYLPLALLCVDKIAGKKEEGRRKKVLWHGVLQFSLVVSLLAGHWQITLYLLAAMVIYIIFVKRSDPAEAGSDLNKFSALLVHFFLFIVLTSFQWFPAWRFMAASNRQVEQQNVLLREGFFIKPKQLVQLIAPDFFGNPATGNYRGVWNYAEQVIYIGVVPLVLALGGAVTKQNKLLGLQRFGLTIVIIGLLLAVKNPVAEIPYRLNIPVLSDLQPTRLGYLITFGLSILAAIGLQNLLVEQRLMLKKSIWASGTVGLALFGLLIVSSKFDFAAKTVSQRNLIFPAGILFMFLFIVSIYFLLKFRHKKSIILLSVICYLLSVVDLFRFGWKFTPFSPPQYLYPVTPAIKFLQENMGPGDRYMTLDRRILPPNANIIYRLESIEGYDPIYSRDYARLITRMETDRDQELPANFGRIVRPGNFHSPIAEELGVKYVLGLNEIEDEKLTKVFQEGETRIYEFF